MTWFGIGCLAFRIITGLIEFPCKGGILRILGNIKSILMVLFSEIRGRRLLSVLCVIVKGISLGLRGDLLECVMLFLWRPWVCWKG